jgi:peroxiredoxin
MKQEKILAGSPFPTIAVDAFDGRHTEDIGKPTGGAEWKMVVVYRGRHCPLCTKYLNKLESYKEPLREIGIDLEAMSGDTKAQLESHPERLDVSFPLYYGLTIEQMEQLGLYISYPRSENETDHPFAEPVLFVVNAEGNVQVVDISNDPFVRPDLEQMYSGLKWIRENSYPIRGTYP